MITQFPDFKPLELFDKKYIETFTVQFPPYSDFNFTSIWAWNTNDKFQISNLNGNLVVLFYDYVSNNPFFSFIGSNKIEDTAARILEYSINKYVFTRFLGVTPKIFFFLSVSFFCFATIDETSSRLYCTKLASKST